MQIDVKYAMVTSEGYVVWMTGTTAENALGHGEQVFSVEEQIMTDGMKVKAFVIECPVWYDSGGVFRMTVNSVDLDVAIRAAHKAVEYIVGEN